VERVVAIVKTVEIELLDGGVKEVSVNEQVLFAGQLETDKETVPLKPLRELIVTS